LLWFGQVLAIYQWRGRWDVARPARRIYVAYVEQTIVFLSISSLEFSSAAPIIVAIILTVFFLLILLEDEVILDTIIKVRLIGHMHLIINGPATTGLCLVTGEWMVKYLTKYCFIWGYIIFPPTTL
jgi:hypothetical protein